MESHYSRLVLTHEPSHQDLGVPEASGEIRDLSYEQLGVGEVREIVAVANRRPAWGELLYLLCRFKSVTIDAQNALLKVLEDTPATTSITLIAPPDCHFLPTVLSRLQVSESFDSDRTSALEEFHGLSPAERIQIIDRKLKAKDVDWVRDIKRELASALHSGAVAITLEIEFLERWLLVRGASNKMLLEQLALSLPVGPVHSKGKR